MRGQVASWKRKLHNEFYTEENPLGGRLIVRKRTKPPGAQIEMSPQCADCILSPGAQIAIFPSTLHPTTPQTS